jgi:hypothetical protein
MLIVCVSRAHTRREGHRHGMQAQHLAEGHLLTSLDRLGLNQQGSDLTAVQVGDKPPVTALTPPGELDIEVNKLTNGSEGVVIGALLGRCLTKHVSEKSSVSPGLRMSQGHC